jgi:aminoglycoside phosphotransferase (APT) family kinase protein
MAGDRFDVLGSRREVTSFRTPPYADRERILSALSSLWERNDANPNIVLCHGDAHVGQLYFERDGRAGLLDWQSIGLMPWAKDVAYFMGSALSVADRRNHERDILAAYLQALKRNGGPQISVADAWDEYRAQMLQGLVWMVVTEQMQPIEVTAALNERYLSAVSDLDSLGVLGF